MGERPDNIQARRRRARWTAALLAAVAVGIFIVFMLTRLDVI